MPTDAPTDNEEKKPKPKAKGGKTAAEKPPEEMINVEVAPQDSEIYKTYSFRDYNPDSLARKKGGLKIYREMKTDEQIKACLSAKKLARLSTKWTIEPGDQDNPQSVEIADFCTHVLKNIRTSMGPEVKKLGEDPSWSDQTHNFQAGSFKSVLWNILSALEYGYSLTEKIWAYYEDGPYKGKLGLIGLKTKYPWGYDFETDNYGNLTGITACNAVQAGKEALRPEKFVIYTYGMECGNWYGNSDLRQAYRPWWSKDMIIKWYNIYLERYGMPTTVIKYPAKGRLSAEMKQSLEDILLNLQAKAGFSIPDNFTAEFLEAKRAGEAGYDKAIERHDKAIARAILIPNKIGYGEDDNGSYALGKKHFDLFLMVLEDLGTDLSETVVDEQMLKPLVAYNFGVLDESLMPHFRFESLVSDDPKPKAEVMNLLIDAAVVDSREDWVREYLTLPKRDIKKYPYRTPIGEPETPLNPFGGGPNDPNNPDDGGDGNGGGTPPRRPFGRRYGAGKPTAKAKFGALGRTPNRFEKKVNFQRLSKNIDLMSEATLAALREVMVDVKKDMEKQVNKFYESGDAREAVRNLKVRGMGPFKNILRDHLVKAHLDNKLAALEELQGDEGFDIDIKRRFSAIFENKDNQAAFEPWEPIPPTEAIDLFNRKVLARVAIMGGEKVLLPLGRGKELKYYDDRAFYISGVEEKYVLDSAKNVILSGLEKGWSNRKIMENLNDTFDKYLAQGVVIDGEVQTAARLETIVRTNLNEAYNRGRNAMFNDPVVAEQIPYVEWSSILDGRTTDYCENMDGKIFRRGEVEAPPAHFNCRSVIVPITQTEVENDPTAISVSVQSELERDTPRASGFQSDDGGDHVHR